MSLHVLAYDFRRLMSLLGMEGMLAAIRAYASLLTLQGLLWSLSVLVFVKIPKRDYGAWGTSLRFILGPGPYNSARSPWF